MSTPRTDPLVGVGKIRPGRAQNPVVPFGRWVLVRDRAAAALLGGATRVVLTGAAGTGKTVMLDDLARVLRAAGRTVEVRLAADPAPPSRGETLFIDEADRLPATKLRHLLDGSEGTVVLAGLGGLTRRAGAGTVRLALEPLGQEEARDYVAQWLGLTGRSPADLESAALRRLVEVSGGVPRLLSTLLGAAAWLAESDGAPTIGAAHIEEAAELRSVSGPNAAVRLDEQVGPRRRAWPALLAASLLAAAAAAALTYLLADEPAPPAEFVERPALPALVEPAAAASEPAPQASEPPAPESPAPEPVLSEPVLPERAASATPSSLPVETLEFLLRRGREMAALEDVSAARLLFRRAAEGGSAEAMYELGRSFDPSLRAGGQADSDQAAHWYGRAAAGGVRSPKQ